MIYAHIFIDGSLYSRRQMHHCPRVGDTLRYGPEDAEKYAKCTEVVWCLNEESPLGGRVNIRLETEKPSKVSKKP